MPSQTSLRLFHHYFKHPPVKMPSLFNAPPPTPPERPDDEDCCQSGCDPCIFDRYYEALERYRNELREWEEKKALAENEDGINSSS